MALFEFISAHLPHVLVKNIFNLRIYIYSNKELWLLSISRIKSYGSVGRVKKKSDCLMEKGRWEGKGEKNYGF